jgi:hypothetical protein
MRAGRRTGRGRVVHVDYHVPGFPIGLGWRIAIPF